MIECLVNLEGWSYDEALEFIDYNTICFSERENYPIIIRTF